MAWTIIPDSDIDPDSPVTTGLMTALRDNVAAAFAKDSGAPVLANNYVVEAMMDTASVKNDSLSNAIGSTGSQAISTSATWTPSAGWYNFMRKSTGTGIVQVSLSANLASLGAFDAGALLYCDGSNMQFKENGTAIANMFWQKLG